MTAEQLVDAINILATHLDNITTILTWSMFALWTIVFIKLIQDK